MLDVSVVTIPNEPGIGTPFLARCPRHTLRPVHPGRQVTVIDAEASPLGVMVTISAEHEVATEHRLLGDGGGPELVNRETGQVLTASQTAARGAGGLTVIFQGPVYDREGARRGCEEALAMAV